MYQSINLPSPPSQLLQYLDTNKREGHEKWLRRRYILGRSSPDGWSLVCCTVEAFPRATRVPEAIPTRRYADVVMGEDWLNSEESASFVDEIQNGALTLGGKHVARSYNPSWRLELLPLRNLFMARAGLCVGIKFSASEGWANQGPLLTADAPYYPDLIEAIRDWFFFPIYHGATDARNGEIIFLLPEDKAFFSAVGSENEELQISIEGSAIDKLVLRVKGAYWTDGAINHFDEPVQAKQAIVRVPAGANRLEYVLTDSEGAIYDFQREDRFNHSGFGRSRLENSRDLVMQIEAACVAGEGLQVEFKPFVGCESGIGEKSKKTKFRELVTTVVAFANTQGGRIYVGIEDDCSIAGIAPELGRWAKETVTDNVIKKYRGQLTSSIKNEVTGDTKLAIRHAYVEGRLIIVIDVNEAGEKPVAVRNDNILYVRVGASNRQVPPSQWASVLNVGRPDTWGEGLL